MNNNVAVEVSARHVHLSEKDSEILFGEGHALTPTPGTENRVQYPAIERLTMQGPRSSFSRVAIMMPLYKEFTQIEVSLTDARALGIEVPVRNSREISGSPGLKIIGPAGEVELATGVIAARRHVHVSDIWAEERGLTKNDVVKLEISSRDRSLVFGDVALRVEKGLRENVAHIDVDEANAAGVSGISEGTVIF